MGELDCHFFHLVVAEVEFDCWYACLKQFAMVLILMVDLNAIDGLALVVEKLTLLFDTLDIIMIVLLLKDKRAVLVHGVI